MGGRSGRHPRLSLSPSGRQARGPGRLLSSTPSWGEPLGAASALFKLQRWPPLFSTRRGGRLCPWWGKPRREPWSAGRMARIPAPCSLGLLGAMGQRHRARRQVNGGPAAAAWRLSLAGGAGLPRSQGRSERVPGRVRGSAAASANLTQSSGPALNMTLGSETKGLPGRSDRAGGGGLSFQSWPPVTRTSESRPRTSRPPP